MTSASLGFHIENTEFKSLICRNTFLIGTKAGCLEWWCLEQVELIATASYSLGKAILASMAKRQVKGAKRKVSRKDLGRKQRGFGTAKSRECSMGGRLALYRKVW